MAIVPWQVTPWWSMQNTLMATHQQAKAQYLERPVTVTAYTFRFNTTQRFGLPHAFSLELSGHYQSPSLFGIYQYKASGQVNVGLQKKLSKQGGTLSLTWQDLFWTTPLRWDISLPEYNLHSYTVLKTAEPRGKADLYPAVWESKVESRSRTRYRLGRGAQAGKLKCIPNLFYT